MSDPMADLNTATTRYQQAEDAFEQARQAVIAAALDALRAGKGPTEVANGSPFTAAYIRRLARLAGIPPAPPGKKPGQARQQRR